MAHPLRLAVPVALAALLLAPALVAGQGPMNAPPYQDVLPSPTGGNGSFAAYVAASGDTILVGAPSYDGAAAREGYVQFWQHGADDRWTSAGIVQATDKRFGSYFGDGVALKGDRAVVGAPGHAGGVAYPGAVYVFERVGGAWKQKQEVFAPDFHAYGWFGFGVGIDGDNLVAGTAQNDTAYVFHRNATGVWKPEATLNGVSGSSFGRGGVAVMGDEVAVVDRFENASAGAVYLYQRSSSGAWSFETKLVPFGPSNAPPYVAMDDGRLLLSGGYVWHKVGGAWQAEARLACGTSAVAIDGDVADCGGLLSARNAATGAWSKRATLDLAGTGSGLVSAVGVSGGTVVEGFPQSAKAVVFTPALYKEGRGAGADLAIGLPATPLGPLPATLPVSGAAAGDSGTVWTGGAAPVTAERTVNLAAQGPLLVDAARGATTALRARVDSTAQVARAIVTLPTGDVLELRGVEATAGASCAGASGDARIALVLLNGVPQAPGGARLPANTRLDLPGGARVVLHEETAQGDAGVEVRAAHVVVPGVLDASIGLAHAAMYGCARAW